MSGRKILTLGLVIGIGITNGYYVFEPTFRENAQNRNPLNLKQSNPAQEDKAEALETSGKEKLGDAKKAS